MRTDEQDPKAPRPIDGGIRAIDPNEDHKQPHHVRGARKNGNVSEHLEAYGRTSVSSEHLDRHLHV